MRDVLTGFLHNRHPVGAPSNTVRSALLALVLLGALVIAPAFATFPAQAACPNPVIGPEDCPPGSRLPVYLRVCFAHVDATCDPVLP